MQAFARLLEPFNAPDPSGATLLDRGLIYGTSEYGEGWKHSVKELPVVLAGGANGRIARGVHARDQGGNLAKAQLTALQALGLDYQSFGFSGAATTETMDGFGMRLNPCRPYFWRCTVGCSTSTRYLFRTTILNKRSLPTIQTPDQGTRPGRRRVR